MQLPFTTSQGGASQTSSVTSTFDDASSKTRSRTGLSAGDNADGDDAYALNTSKFKARSSTFSGFFRGLGSKRISQRTNRFTKTIKPSSSKPQLSSLDINDAAVQRIMGKPKESRHASENLLLQQKGFTPLTLGKIGPNPTGSRHGLKERGDAKYLTSEETQNMFVGAPYFNASKTKNGYRPQVTFVDKKSKEYSPAMTDCRPFGHLSFEASSLNHVQSKTDAESLPRRNRAALQEMPSMRSSQGFEPGTIGFEHYLQLAVSDNIDRIVEPPVFRNRRLITLNPAQIGLRELNTDDNIDRLAELDLLRQELEDRDTISATMNKSRVTEMGDHLFSTLLYPPPPLLESEKPDLITQIEALQAVLALPGLWHDFSLPETRLRIGQLLWSAPNIPRRPSYEERYLEPSDREIILLQIALASELLVRLVIVESLALRAPDSTGLLVESARIAIEDSRNLKVSWDLVLAERFLDNVSLSARIPNKTVRNGLFSKISYLASREGPEPFYEPRNPAEQIRGLVIFAQALKWPTAAGLEDELMTILLQPENEAQPKSPASQDSELSDRQLRRKPSGFTGDLEYSSANEKAQRFLGISRRPSRPNTGKQEPEDNVDFGPMDTLQAMQLHPRLAVNADGRETNMGGWLSQTWLSGLVLPGDAASHFLMSTLLENTPNAIETLGEVANLCGGFVYKGRTYWSKQCVAGRVMASVRGAKECMGWIAITGAPTGQKDGWIQIESKNAPHLGYRDPKTVGQSSDPMGTGKTSGVQETDFILPQDGPPVMGNQVQNHGLHLKPPKDNGKGAIATITFSSPVNRKLSNLEVELTHNVHFVSAYPCHPYDEDLMQKIVVTGEDWDSMLPPGFMDDIPKDSARLSRPMMEPLAECFIPDDTPGPPLACHALHVDYKFDMIPVAALLSAPSEQRDRMRKASIADPGNASDDDHHVVVLECRGSKDLQLLARAWCAQIGENAVVAKAGRTCLSCSVREAYALAIAIVIRI